MLAIHVFVRSAAGYSDAVRAAGSSFFASAADDYFYYHQGTIGGSFYGNTKVRRRRHSSHSRPIRPILCASHVWSHAFHGCRHVYARCGGR